jgi:signal transduction histidine kinase
MPVGGRQAPSDDTERFDASDPSAQPALPHATDNVDSRDVLRRIVRAARELLDAKYAALAVLGDGRTVVDLITDGLTEAEAARIGPYPEAHGLLGRLIDDPRPMRIGRIDEHPAASGGFPPHHPKMTSLLGVPVHVHDEVYGLLYLADKRNQEEFTEADERAVVALGSAAGIAIRNARLYILSERRRRWLEASADITRRLLERPDRDAALRAVTLRARELSRSDGACVLLADDSDRLVVHEVDGDTVSELRGRVVSGQDPALTRVREDGLPTTIADLRTLFEPDDDPITLARSALLVPFRSSTNAVGVLLVVEPTPSPSPEDEYMLQTFAAQAAIALDLAQARSDGETVVVLEDRDRIARDLHDVVIQRLFATGLMLQGAHRVAAQPEVRERIETAVNELDTTIRDLRSAIFELHRRTTTSLRSEISRLVSDYSNLLGFSPRLSVRGPLDTLVDGALAVHVLAVVREALSNVAKHAHASSVQITLTASDREVVARIVDNGVGLDIRTGESGLRNIRERAEGLGGSVTIDRAKPRGTVVEWRAHLRPTRPR